MNGIKSFLSDSHTLLAVLILIAISVFVGIDKMTVDQWKNTVDWIFAIWGGTHVGVSVADAIASRSPDPADQAPSPAPAAIGTVVVAQPPVPSGTGTGAKP